MVKHHSFIVDKCQLRLDQYLVGKLPELSRSKIQNLIKLGQVTIDGEIGKSSLILHGNESIECNFVQEIQNKSIPGESMDINIIFEDDFIAVINKPSGLVIHPGNGNSSGTLLNGLIHYFSKLSNSDSERPGIIHRLDKDTSGILIIAKNDASHEFISHQFSKREIKKEYVALVWGKVNSVGVINANLGRDSKDRKLFKIVNNGGKDSITKYKLDGYFPPLSWVRLYPETGRTHQLRVHLKSIGHPIFCDNSYGGGKQNAKSFHIKYTQILNRLIKSVNRVALHAHTIEFRHPESKKRIKFEASIPEDLNIALNLLKNEYL